MRVTIIKDDSTVVVDGVPYVVDCSDLPADLHALQWDGARGEIEYSVMLCEHCGTRSKKNNETISDAAPYQKYLDAWYAAKVEAEAKAAAQAAEVEARLAAQAAAQTEVTDVTGPQG